MNIDGTKLKGTEVFGFLLESYKWAKPKYDKVGYVLEGSSGSSKTVSIIQFLLMYAQSNQGKLITACRAKMTWVTPSIWQNFNELVGAYNLDYTFNRSRYEAYHNKNAFRFVGADNPQKLHGPRQQVFWANEGMELSQKSFNQVNMRTDELWFIDFNPSTDKHWIFSSLLKGMTPFRHEFLEPYSLEPYFKETTVYDDELEREITECIFYIHSTFRHNGFLPAGQRKVIRGYEPTPENIEAGSADQWHWDVYGLGKRAAPRGAIFPLWKEVPYLPDEIVLERSKAIWLDFGFSNDPTAMGRIYTYKGQLYVKSFCYETDLTNVINEEHPEQRSIELVLRENGVDSKDIIIADSAERKSIRELRLKGYQVIPIEKGHVRVEITRLKKYRVNIVNSPDIAEEKRLYVWKENYVTGELFNEPVDAWNHHIDGIRYAVKFLEEKHLI